MLKEREIKNQQNCREEEKPFYFRLFRIKMGIDKVCASDSLSIGGQEGQAFRCSFDFES
jgi:hypothetical protein